ncbi:hypothetical protein AA0Y32_13120 [Georgenia phoenicis]|uniref:hypothetical protein n=1 Tax=unclassified Georgenia TaxID=2626815 RepID=UPI0039AF738D
MPLFEFEAGQLIPAQVGHAVTGPVEPEVLDAVRAQVLEMLRLPVFPVTWQDDDGAPRLTAMDPAGHVVSVEVLERLDARALVAALGRAGRSGERGWIDVARSYPNGVGAFRRDWNAFRESQPVGTVVAARVHVVAAQIDDDARQALDALAGAGVVVHELAVRAMSSGRLFLDVNEVSVPVAPLPWLLPGRTVAALEQPAAPEALEEAQRPLPSRRSRRRHATAEPAPAAPSPQEAAQQPADAPLEDLVGIGQMLGDQAPLVWVLGEHSAEATLQPDGWIVVDGRPFAAPEAATGAVAGADAAPQAWDGWRFGAEGPSLREAREELYAHRERARRRAEGPGLRRRRRRAASE